MNKKLYEEHKKYIEGRIRNLRHSSRIMELPTRTYAIITDNISEFERSLKFIHEYVEKLEKNQK
jgi:hypothetical protein